MDNEDKKEKTWQDEIGEQVENQIKEIRNQQVQQGNIDYLGKLVDIKKDLKEMEESNMYGARGNYGEYGASYGRRGVPGSGRGYRGGSYNGGRGSGNYRGEEALNEMNYHYGNYRESYNAGNYGAKEDSAYKMTEAFKDFGFTIAEELEPNEKMMFKKAMQEIMQELER